MKLVIATLLAAAVIAAPFAASASCVTPAPGPDGIQQFVYGGATPPTLTCAPLFLCDLSLEKGEAVSNVAIGDSVRWLLSPVANGAAGSAPHILIKPTDAGLSTNLIVTTNERTYVVNLRSTKTPGTSLRAEFISGDDTPATPAPAPAAVATAAPEPPPPALDFNYKSTGDERIMPAEVYNDGKHVYVRFAQRPQQIPTLLAIGPDGDQLVNYRVTDGTTYVVDGLPDKLALVIGSGKHQQRVTIAHS